MRRNGHVTSNMRFKGINKSVITIAQLKLQKSK